MVGFGARKMKRDVTHKIEVRRREKSERRKVQELVRESAE